MPRANGPQRKRGVAKWLPLAFACLLATSWLTVAAFGAPLHVTERLTEQEAKLEATIDQYITPRQSTLYPDPEPLHNEPFAYMRLLAEVALDLTVTARTAPAAAVTGTTEIVADVVAPERWSRTFVLRELRPFSLVATAEALPVIAETVYVPADEYAEFIAAVEDETRVMPRDDYQIVVRAVVELTAAGENATVTEKFDIPFTFRLAGNTLYADGPYAQQLSARKTRDVVHPGTLSLFGQDVPVMAMRVSSAAANVVALTACVWLFWRWRQQVATVPELERIMHRYRDRLIEATGHRSVSRGNVIHVSSMHDLVRLADQVDQSILVLRQPDVVRFVVIDGEIEYSFRPMATDQRFPAQRAAGSMQADGPPS